jgi:flagellar basal body-associated protein FliL
MCRIVVLLILTLLGLLAAGTAYALLRSPASGPLFRIGSPAASGANQSGAAPAGRAPDSDALSVFTGIGRLRIPLQGGVSASAAGGPAPATLILSVAFPYPPGDRAFSEELASKVGDFRSIVVDYFSSLPAGELVSLDEEAAKTEILRRYNAGLRLGTIKSLYFSDLMLIE